MIGLGFSTAHFPYAGGFRAAAAGANIPFIVPEMTNVAVQGNFTGSYTPAAPLQEGDISIIFVSSDGGGYTTENSGVVTLNGWTQSNTIRGGTDSPQCAIFYKVMGPVPDTEIIIPGCGNTNFRAVNVSLVVRGSSGFDGGFTYGAAGGANVAPPNITTTQNDCLLLTVTNMDDNGIFYTQFPSENDNVQHSRTPGATGNGQSVTAVCSKPADGIGVQTWDRNWINPVGNPARQATIAFAPIVANP